MAEPLKNLYSHSLIDSLANEFKLAYPVFRSQAFIDDVLLNDWKKLELKERMHRVANALGKHLPPHFPDAVEILLPVSDKFTGLEHLLFPDFVEQFGMDHFKISMKALEHLTSGSSSEFAIRPFIQQWPDKTMKQMDSWSRSKNEHIRRLASEGCRPRLPWAMALPDYKRDPTDVLEIILKLIKDESLYVRRSVANNLNDISKDNPDLLIEIAEQHLGASRDTDWVIKHACRGLLKQGHKKVLHLFGYTAAQHVSLDNFKTDKKISMGERINFSFKLITDKKTLGKLRLEFIIDFIKANGKSSAKIFKISEGEYTQSSKTFTKYFSFKKISTRKYYPGDHAISIVINGNKVATQSFKLAEN